MGTSKSLHLLIVALLSFAGCARSVDYGQCSSSQIPRAPSSELAPLLDSSTDDARGAEPLPSVEFFDVASSRDALLVAGIDGLYRFDAKGRVETIAIREWKDFAGIKVSFEVSDFVAVLTAVRQNGTLNDGVPMIVSRAH